MQTVRASFTVPGKGGVVAAVDNDPFESDERMGREQRHMRYVNKSELVLKEHSEELPTEETAIVEEVHDPALDEANTTEDVKNSVANIEHIIPGLNENHIKHENLAKSSHKELPVANARLAKYAKLVIDQPADNKKKWFGLEVDEEGRGKF